MFFRLRWRSEDPCLELMQHKERPKSAMADVRGKRPLQTLDPICCSFWCTQYVYAWKVLWKSVEINHCCHDGFGVI